MSRAVVAALYALQQLDLDIDRGVTELDAVKRACSEDATRSAREAVARAREAAERARRKAQVAEQAVHAAESRIRQLEARLYGGGTAMRDLGALETELAHLKEAHAKHEEEALALMLAAEEAEEAATAATQAHRTSEQDWKGRQRELQVRAARLESSLTDLRARRQRQAADIDASSLQRYDALRPAHRGRGVAAVENGICQQCRISLTPAALHRARSSAELVTCGNCGCILYVP